MDWEMNGLFTLLFILAFGVFLIVKGMALDGRFNHGFRYRRWGSRRLSIPKWVTLKMSGRNAHERALKNVKRRNEK